jgi:hypothetical protein
MIIRKRKSRIAPIAVTGAVFTVFAAFAITMLNGASATAGDEAAAALERSITRAAVSCYAFEGWYPDCISYLETHYNLVLDRERYMIHYDKIADNIMPIIAVKEWGG